jgi:hypothetical protein
LLTGRRWSTRIPKRNKTWETVEFLANRAIMK